MKRTLYIIGLTAAMFFLTQVSLWFGSLWLVRVSTQAYGQISCCPVLTPTPIATPSRPWIRSSSWSFTGGGKVTLPSPIKSGDVVYMVTSCLVTLANHCATTPIGWFHDAWNHAGPDPTWENLYHLTAPVSVPSFGADSETVFMIDVANDGGYDVSPVISISNGLTSVFAQYPMSATTRRDTLIVDFQWQDLEQPSNVILTPGGPWYDFYNDVYGDDQLGMYVDLTATGPAPKIEMTLHSGFSDSAIFAVELLLKPKS